MKNKKLKIGILITIGYVFNIFAQHYQFHTENITHTQQQENTITQPNPSDGFYINAGNSVAKIYIYDIGGDLLESRKATGTTFINVAQYGSGVYIIKIAIGDKTITRKLHIK